MIQQIPAVLLQAVDLEAMIVRDTRKSWKRRFTMPITLFPAPDKRESGRQEWHSCKRRGRPARQPVSTDPIMWLHVLVGPSFIGEESFLLSSHSETLRKQQLLAQSLRPMFEHDKMWLNRLGLQRSGNALYRIVRKRAQALCRNARLRRVRQLAKQRQSLATRRHPSCTAIPPSATGISIQGMS